MAIVGISGSPIVGGNTDRIIKALLEKSGKETKFINLSTLKFSPCRACAHLCGTTNMCGVKDDLQPYLADIRDAEVLILGSPIHHGNCTAWTYSFISRLWCLYQVKKLLQDKPAIFVSVGIHDRDRQNGICNFERIATYSEKLKILGHIYYNSQTPPCLKCGAGAYCKVGGLWGILNGDEDKLKNFQFTPDKFHQWEDCMEVVNMVEQYGQALAKI
jgi:multimeric flavodoxin WrbA